MTVHFSARVSWHDSGWNGHICSNPQENVYCVGPFSYPGDRIAEERDLQWEMNDNIRGHSCAKIDHIPPCCLSVNAFGSETVKAYVPPPDFFYDNTETKELDIPPYTVGLWPYEEMYKAEVKFPEGSQRKYDYEKRFNSARDFFNELEPERSLIFYYSNYSNPFSDVNKKRYVLVGVSRLKELGPPIYYDGVSEINKEKYHGGFVWQKSVTSCYPDQGFRLPYHLFMNDPDKLESFLFVPDNARLFKYATRHISDDDALDLVNSLLITVDELIKLGDRSEDWKARKEWLQTLISELWDNRGAFPGLPSMLNFMGFGEAIPYFKSQVEAHQETEAKDRIFSLLNGEVDTLGTANIPDKDLKRVRRQWALKDGAEQNLLADFLPRFDLSVDQLKRVLGDERQANGVYCTLDNIAANPYLICEQYVGDNLDDKIGFNKIDHGMIPSPQLGIDRLAENDDWRRFRALVVARLKKEETHAFLPASQVIEDINRKLSVFEEWKRHQFREKYFEVDKEDLSGALTFKQHNERLYLYINSVFEDERFIERTMRSLAQRPPITTRTPVTETDWHDYLYESESMLAKRTHKAYEEAVQKQVGVCEQIFTAPLCVISGTAGTGKTTVINALIQAIQKTDGAGTSFNLLAPTGKAADRIREKTNVSASTIHSFLASHRWLNDRNLTIKRDGGTSEHRFNTYIIDEASMLDLELTAALFRAIDWTTVKRLILVGDHNQLPPIKRGCVFIDLIKWLQDSNRNALGILDTNMRQMENEKTGQGTGIIRLSQLYATEVQDTVLQYAHKTELEDMLHRVQQGGDIDHDLRVVYWKGADDLQNKLQTSVISDLERETGSVFDANRPHLLWKNATTDRDGQRRVDYQQVITPYRGESFGVDALNILFQQLFYSECVHSKGTLGGITLFDKVIQTVNRAGAKSYYAFNRSTRKNERIDVFNGEIGCVQPSFSIRNWSKDRKRLKEFNVVFSRKGDFLVPFKLESEVESNLELAYAISVHKAQGSEFDHLYFILPNNKRSLLTKPLLYTGMTRAKKHLTILVEEDISPFLSLYRFESSQINRINSSIFYFKPLPDELLNMPPWYEEGRIHQTVADYMVRSKSEVIIANLLFDRGINFEYERPLYADDDSWYLPDFTITWRGDRWYWEHLGRCDLERYRRKWEAKEKWYETHFPGRLVTTTESPTLSKDAEAIIQQYFSDNVDSIVVESQEKLSIQECTKLTDEFFDLWLESLPYPLARILWRYTAKQPAEDKINLLLSFFESLAVFNSVAMLSAFVQDTGFYDQERCTWLGEESYDKRFIKPSFGDWNELAARLAKATREVRKDPQKRDKLLDLFGGPGCEELIEAVTRKKLNEVLSSASNYRNLWKGHGSAEIGNKGQKERLELIKKLLIDTHKTICHRYSTVLLFTPRFHNMERDKDGVYNYVVKVFKGTRRPVQEKDIQSSSELKSGNLYLAPIEPDEPVLRPIRLLPFVQLKECKGEDDLRSEIDAYTFYFYSGLNKNEVRWVSHDCPEMHEFSSSEDLNAILEALNWLKCN